MFIEGLGLEANERANKAALILVHDRYSKQIAPFVKGQAARLSYVEPQIDALIIEASEETNADVQYVKDRFTAFLRESVPSSVPDESTGIRNNTPEGMDEFFKTDVMDRGEVPGLGADEARDEGVEKQDLGDNTLGYDALQPTAARSKCARCDSPLDKKIASETDVCANCTRELLAKTKEADASWNNDGDILGPSGTGTAISDPSQQGLVQPAQQDTPFTCTICGQQGSQQDMLTHVQNDHADVLQRMQQQNQPQPGQPMMGAVKEADPAAGDISPAEVQPLPQSPGDRFDSIVQDLAERAAARHFSKPTDADFHTLASQLGVDEQQIRENLIAMAQFGNYAGINGELSDDATPPEGYEPVSLQNGGNNAHRAEVPTDLVVSKVAEDMNLDDNLAQQMIQDHYGGVDLPSVYNANVQGQQLFYLPTDLAGNQQQQTQPQPATDPNVGPAFQQTPPGAPVPAQPGTVPQQ